MRGLDQFLTLLWAGCGLLIIGVLFPMGNPRLLRSRVVTVLLIAATAAAVALAVTSAWAGTWDGLLALALLLLSAIEWDLHIAERRGHTTVITRWVAALLLRRYRLAVGPSGRRLQSMEELRVEYGQAVLADAARDPVLAHLIDQLAADFEEQIFRDDPERALAGLRLTAFANGYLDAMSEPGRQSAHRPYRGYSPDMLAVAALCQLAEHYLTPQRT